MVGGSYNHRSVASGSVYNGDTYYLVGAAYTKNGIKVSGGYMSETVRSQAPVVESPTRNGFGGVSYRINSRYSVTAAYYRTSAPLDKAHRRDLGVMEADYSLSKRTVLYAEFDYTHFRDTAVSTLNTVGVPNQKACTFGINHRF